MQKRDRLFGEIEKTYLTGRDLSAYLEENSNLPGPRANVELAYAFADFIESYGTSDSSLFELCPRMVEVSPEEAPTNNPREIVPFCAAVAIGRLTAIDGAPTEHLLSLLRSAARDPAAASAALAVHRDVVAGVANNEFSESPETAVLIKALCYTLSVAVAALPDEGFSFLHSCGDVHHTLIDRILRENLKKKRLRRVDEVRVAQLLASVLEGR